MDLGGYGRIAAEEAFAASKRVSESDVTAAVTSELLESHNFRV